MPWHTDRWSQGVCMPTNPWQCFRNCTQVLPYIKASSKYKRGKTGSLWNILSWREGIRSPFDRFGYLHRLAGIFWNLCQLTIGINIWSSPGSDRKCNVGADYHFEMTSEIISPVICESEKCWILIAIKWIEHF